MINRIGLALLTIAALLTPLGALAALNVMPRPVSVELRLVEPAAAPGLTEVKSPVDGTPLFLNPVAVVNNGMVQNAKVMLAVEESPRVQLMFTPEAAKKFEEFTRTNIGRKMVTLIDGGVVGLATIREPVSGGLCEFGVGSRQEAERIVLALAAPLPPFKGATPEAVASSYFTALQERGEVVVVEFMHTDEMARFKNIFLALLEKESVLGKSGLVELLFGEGATLADVKGLSPKAFMALFIDRVSGLLPNTGFEFEKLEVLGSVPEGDIRHVLTRIQFAVAPVSVKQMEVVSMKREGDEWKLMLTKEFEGLLQKVQTPAGQ